MKIIIKIIKHIIRTIIYMFVLMIFFALVAWAEEKQSLNDLEE